MVTLLWVQSGGQGGLDPHSSGKSQVAMGFLINYGTDPPREAIGPLGSNCFLREVRMAKMTKDFFVRTPLTKFLDPPIQVVQEEIEIIIFPVVLVHKL